MCVIAAFSSINCDVDSINNCINVTTADPDMLLCYTHTDTSYNN